MAESAPTAIDVLGVRVHAVRLSEALELLARFIAGRQPRQVVTVNPEFVVQARRDPAFRAVLAAADLALADGVGLVWASRLLGRPLPGRVTGADLTERLAALAAQRGYRLYLLGAAEGVAAAAAAALRQRFPGLQIAGIHAGSPRPEADAATVALVRAAAPDVLLVAYGAPAQDLWIHRNLAALGVPLAIGVGGTLDYLSGRTPRAPGWVRRLGMEWLYRLVRQPWRWRRQLRLPVFVALVLRQRFAERNSSARAVR